jgi:hypothetical protein
LKPAVMGPSADGRDGDGDAPAVASAAAPRTAGR